MCNKNKLLLLIILLITPSLIYSQNNDIYIEDSHNKTLSYISFGLRLGIGMSKFQGMDKYGNRIAGTDILMKQNLEPNYGAAWDIGLSVQTMFKERLLIQYDLTIGFSNTSFKKSYTEEGNQPFKRLMHDNSNLTIFVGTKLPVNNNLRFVFGAGPYAGFNLTGNYGTSGNIYNGILETEDGNYKSSDFGVAAMGGIEFRNIQIAINYQHGLTNLVNDKFPIYNRVLKVTGTYYF